MTGYDYTARIAPAALLAAGCTDVFRYITDPSWPKSIQAPEYAELAASPLRLHLNDETAADFMLGGYNVGVQQAQASRARARTVGAPDSSRIYYSLDIGATAAQIAVALDFLHGAADADGKGNVGAYGEYAFVTAALDAGFAAWGTVAWSAGRRDSRAFAWQTGEQRTVGGVTVDVNDINPAALGGPTAGGTSMGSYTMSAGWQTDYPDVAVALQQHIPVGTVIDEGLAAAYAMVRSFVSAERDGAIEAKLDQLLARPAVAQAPAVDVVALAAALGPQLHPTTDVNAFVAALLPHLPGAPDPVAFVDALLAHVKVVP